MEKGEVILTEDSQPEEWHLDPEHPLHELHVPEDQRLDEDGGEGSDASEGGNDTDGFLDAIVENPGEVVEEEDLQ